MQAVEQRDMETPVTRQLWELPRRTVEAIRYPLPDGNEITGKIALMFMLLTQKGTIEKVIPIEEITSQLHGRVNYDTKQATARLGWILKNKLQNDQEIDFIVNEAPRVKFKSKIPVVNSFFVRGTTEEASAFLMDTSEKKLEAVRNIKSWPPDRTPNKKTDPERSKRWKEYRKLPNNTEESPATPLVMLGERIGGLLTTYDDAKTDGEIQTDILKWRAFDIANVLDAVTEMSKKDFSGPASLTTILPDMGDVEKGFAMAMFLCVYAFDKCNTTGNRVTIYNTADLSYADLQNVIAVNKNLFDYYDKECRQQHGRPLTLELFLKFFRDFAKPAPPKSTPPKPAPKTSLQTR